MKIWQITGFDEGPHWGLALIQAPTREAAIAILAAKLSVDEEHMPDTVWRVTEQEKWRAVEFDEPLDFILGSGCRS